MDFHWNAQQREILQVHNTTEVLFLLHSTIY